jgi:hypothetical protein
MADEPEVSPGSPEEVGAPAGPEPGPGREPGPEPGPGRPSDVSGPGSGEPTWPGVPGSGQVTAASGGAPGPWFAGGPSQPGEETASPTTQQVPGVRPDASAGYPWPPAYGPPPWGPSGPWGPWGPWGWQGSWGAGWGPGQGAPYPSNPPPPARRRPQPWALVAVALATAALLAFGVGIGFIVWGSHGTAASRTPSANPLRPIVPPSGATLTSPRTVRKRGFLGVEVSPSTSTKGASVVGVVATSPAAKAGIVKGDTITSFNTRPVVSAFTLAVSVERQAPGAKAKVGWTTPAGKHETATVTLSSRPGNRSTE